MDGGQLVFRIAFAIAPCGPTRRTVGKAFGGLVPTQPTRKVSVLGLFLSAGIKRGPSSLITNSWIC